MTHLCPQCGSTDVEPVDPETGYCYDCEFEGRAGLFERAGSEGHAILPVEGQA